MKIKIGSKVKRKNKIDNNEVYVDPMMINYLSELRSILDQGSRNQMFIGSILRFYKIYGRVSEKQFYWVESLREQNGLPTINHLDELPEIKRPDLNKH